jgi:homoaconitase/3-isopropylmalate dehydratase large subunit
MGMTFAEKILAEKAGMNSVTPGQIVRVSPDRLMSVSASSAIPIRYFRQLEIARVWDPERIVLILDHETPPNDPAHAESHAIVRRFAAEQGIEKLFDVGEGICHQLMIEKGLVFPGELIFGKDSHTVTYGAVGAFATPIDATEMACLWATGETWLKVPMSIRIWLTGRLKPPASAKDLILYLIGQIKSDGATYMSVEFLGPGAASLSIEERMTVANMTIEMGAKNGVFPYDAGTEDFISRFHAQFQPVLPDPDAGYAGEQSVDLSQLVPQIACPHRVFSALAPMAGSTTWPPPLGYLMGKGSRAGFAS